MRYLAALLLWTSIAQAAPQTVVVSQAWARATLPHQDTGAVYMTLLSRDGDSLTSVEAPDAGMAMLHQVTHRGAMEGMADMDSLSLPPGQSVTLAPGGMHIMLMDLKHALTAGSKLHIKLHFAHAGTQDVLASVRPIGTTKP